MQALALVVALVLVAGCLGGSRDAPGTESGENTTGDGSGPSGAAPVTLTVSTTAPYSFAPASLSAPAGALVNLTYTNNDPILIQMHDWVLDEADAATDVVGVGASSSVAFLAPAAGTYEFYCSVGNHRALGMVGTFVAE